MHQRIRGLCACPPLFYLSHNTDHPHSVLYIIHGTSCALQGRHILRKMIPQNITLIVNCRELMFVLGIHAALCRPNSGFTAQTIGDYGQVSWYNGLALRDQGFSMLRLRVIINSQGLSYHLVSPFPRVLGVMRNIRS